MLAASGVRLQLEGSPSILELESRDGGILLEQGPPFASLSFDPFYEGRYGEYISDQWRR